MTAAEQMARAVDTIAASTTIKRARGEDERIVEVNGGTIAEHAARLAAAARQLAADAAKLAEAVR